MRNIIFVDNDSVATRKLKKLLGTMCPEWEIEVTRSGKEALDLMSRSPFDVIVSDLRIQGMNGIELFETVSESYPETVRIIHSEASDLRSTMIVHQFLKKPCSAEAMKNTILRTYKLQELLRKKILRKTVAGIKNLPSLPRLYNMIVEEMQSPDVSLKKVGYLISQDISMSAKILQLVNSAFFALPQKITDPQQASVYIGLETLKSLVLSIHVFSSLTKDAESYGFFPVKMWKHSLKTGKLASDIARSENADRAIVDGAMISGMLHDIGKLIILLEMPKEFIDVMNLVEATGCCPTEAEYSILDTSHAELGAYLLGLWGLPGNVIESVAFHHKPSELIERMFNTPSETIGDDSEITKSKDADIKLQAEEKPATAFTALTAVHIANALTMQGDCSSDTPYFPYVDMSYLKKLGLTDRLPQWVELYEQTKQVSEINIV
ncbi:signal transduction protein [Candidatus Scalindua japonica]|uniref:Signal transduction protein n=1 Tax=Candidatus Scalindua japonica TaxID=1284222 RepID=A0A286TTM7_9BACT|nr:response regulator [Candidatus Scalindua japonica]GAX59211.1 signal transduction protein [Candidatus Scalindua japonica]